MNVFGTKCDANDDGKIEHRNKNGSRYTAQNTICVQNSWNCLEKKINMFLKQFCSFVSRSGRVSVDTSGDNLDRCIKKGEEWKLQEFFCKKIGKKPTKILFLNELTEVIGSSHGKSREKIEWPTYRHFFFFSTVDNAYSNDLWYLHLTEKDRGRYRKRMKVRIKKTRKTFFHWSIILGIWCWASILLFCFAFWSRECDVFCAISYKFYCNTARDCEKKAVDKTQSFTFVGSQFIQVIFFFSCVFGIRLLLSTFWVCENYFVCM